jgi:hypothetical protein
VDPFQSGGITDAALISNLTGAQAWGCLDLSGAQVDSDSLTIRFSSKGTRLDRAAFSRTMETLEKVRPGTRCGVRTCSTAISPERS